MDFELSDTQRLMQQTARSFLAKECTHERVRSVMATDTAFDEKLWRAVAAQGWLGMMLSEDCGGLALGVVELAAVAEEMGRACLPGPVLSTLWGAEILRRAPGQRWTREHLPAVASGDLRLTVALLEESAEWDPRAVRLSAVRTQNGYQLDGRKQFVGDAAVAGLIICAARDEEGLVLMAVDPDTKGVSITASPGIDATRKLDAVDLSGVRVAADDVLARGETAAKILEESTAVANVVVCAELLGGMQWMLDTAADYVKIRKQFGRAIGSFQAVQHQCADMMLYVESARSAVYFAAWALSTGDPIASHAVSIAKMYCSDAAREVGNRAIQVHGGIGFTWEHNLHLYYKRAKAAEFLFGDATEHRERLAQLILDRRAG